jgi:hypothetical protein
MASKEEMKEYNEAQVPEFLTELAALTKKYGIEIFGCGCCGSPLICGLNGNTPPKLNPGYGYGGLRYNEDAGCYTVKDFRTEQEINNENN